MVSNVESRFLSYTLSGLLEDGMQLVFDQSQTIISLVSEEHGRVLFFAQERCNLSEYRVILALVRSYPYFCPYHELHAANFGGSIEGAKREMEEAYEEGDWDSFMRPVRNVVSRCRIKLRLFGLDTASILETGYMLKRKKGEME